MGGAGATDMIYTLCDNLHALRVIETGVSCGWSSLAILLSFASALGVEPALEVDLEAQRQEPEGGKPEKHLEPEPALGFEANYGKILLTID
jgi:hypothetical protein